MSSQLLKFYTDKHIAKAVAAQLRIRGIDAVRCEEVGMAQAKDFEHLEYALAENRILITNDSDFTDLAAQWRVSGRNHAGIIFCLSNVQGTAGIGKIVTTCIQYDELIADGAGTIEDDIMNLIVYVS